MINLGLSAADQRAFEAGLLVDHKTRCTVDILDMNHNVVASTRRRVLGGQVDWDTKAEENTAERTAQVQIWDPGFELGLDTGAPTDAALFADRMLRIRYGVWSQQLPRWIDVPVFCGPISRLERGESDILQIWAEGKDALLQRAICENHRWRKGTLLTTAARELLGIAGETHMSIPPSSARLPRDYSVAPTSRFWPCLQSMVRSMSGRRATYDGRGVLVAKAPSSRPVWVFRQGRGGSLTSQPQVKIDPSAIRNIAVVTGGVPKGAKRPVTATVTLPASHPYSSKRLGVGGRPRWLRVDVTDETITTVAAAKARAQAELAAAAASSAEVTLTSLVIPHLEPGDVIEVHAGTWAWTFAAAKATLPLTGDGHMSINRQYTVRKAARPNARKKKTTAMRGKR